MAPAQGIVGFRQQEIGTTINRSNLTAAAGGGLIFALIDAGVNNHRAKKAESAASPVRDALIDYQPGEVLAAAVRQQLGQASLLPVEDVEIQQVKDNDSIKEWIKTKPSKTLVMVDTHYGLMPGFNGVRVIATVSFHPAADKPSAGAVQKRNLPGLVYY
ncbi:hypothetical protein, partial [Klebsiella pneumoniae]|uniref:hypothetical protein n=1 Tax=Klebsiella pneumoniae TaxID=573 RepID=UPI0021CE55C4